MYEFKKNGYIGTINAENTAKINKLLSPVTAGVVVQSFWLTEQDYNLEFQKRQIATITVPALAGLQIGLS